MKTESNKVQKIIVDNDHTGQRLDNFLLNFLKGIPKSKIYSIIRKGEVRVNSLRKKVSYKITKDDLIRIPPLNLPIRSDKVPSISLIKYYKITLSSKTITVLLLINPLGLLLMVEVEYPLVL